MKHGRLPSGSRHAAESRVRAARIEKGLSQTELAEAAGLTRQAVYSIESQHYLPNVTTALRLARTLGTRVEDLPTACWGRRVSDPSRAPATPGSYSSA